MIYLRVVSKSVLVHSPASFDRVLRGISYIENEERLISHQHVISCSSNVSDSSLLHPKSSFTMPPRLISFGSEAVKLPCVREEKGLSKMQFKQIILVQVQLLNRVRTIEILNLFIVFVGKVVANKEFIIRDEANSRWKQIHCS